jgi:ribosomal protein S18 acetylase RimI-like enzyme
VIVASSDPPPSVRHQYRGLLLGAVHPHHRRRGLGTFLLHWSERRAAALLRALPDDRSKVLRIELSGSRDDATPLYGHLGFGLHHVEIEMQRDLRPGTEPIPDAPLPAELTLAEWAPERAHLFYETCVDAFDDRPGAMWTQNEWVSGFASGGLRVDLSWLAFSGTPVGFNWGSDGETAQGAGYIMCDVHDVREANGHDGPSREVRSGRIRQVGGRRRWRNRGVASALLCAALRAFQREGAERAELEVNINNPRARHLYERLGFAVVRSFTVYTKPPLGDA